ncbi:hypothetical protein [Solitalea canadensis]|uniref:DUF1440 domain-containing protein n=1 Tax=Solitalea canadensis (strain ATCC 29591 / DSM 3403 / JCM 21819 / LMG 8368 / NBRC 15130 / NCIMB 12057 / USAM 9D) TaxID=929556 RepID=H8KP84_SOLCM|nr:hypothetical protein [Solitalea canadensis]AFD05721.1 Protein of unknown function (DUF1440) [Solitalea canadensis DSM 3403]
MKQIDPFTSDLRSGNGALKAILISGFVAGTLDILSAFLVHSVFGKSTVEKILQFIASGVYGMDAFKGGIAMALAGLFFHFVIAYGFAVFYYYASKHIDYLHKNPLVSGLLYGLFAWLVMNYVVLPYSSIPQPKKAPTFGAQLISIACVMFFVGLPIAYIIRNFYNKQYKHE